MTSVSAGVMSAHESQVSAIRSRIDTEIEDLLASLPDAAGLSAPARRAIIAKYAAVLEGNFIYWMTGAYLAARSTAAREKILDNLREEVRDCHPGMMRRFAAAAGAVPSTADADAVQTRLMDVRLFIGRLAPVPLVTAMAFLEGFIQRFMPYLADLARGQGSNELEYTDVHGVCDITHTEELFRALDSEIALEPRTGDLFEGVTLIRRLVENIVAA